MLKLTVFKIKEGIEKSWDEVDFENDLETVATIEGDTNEECEKLAAVEYSDNEIYGWTYGELND